MVAMAADRAQDAVRYIELVLKQSSMGALKTVVEACSTDFFEEVVAGRHGDPRVLIARADVAKELGPVAALFESLRRRRAASAEYRSTEVVRQKEYLDGLTQLELKVTYHDWMAQCEVVHTDTIVLGMDGSIERLLPDHRAQGSVATPPAFGPRSHWPPTHQVVLIRRPSRRFAVVSRACVVPTHHTSSPDAAIFVYAPHIHGGAGDGCAVQGDASVRLFATVGGTVTALDGAGEQWSGLTSMAGALVPLKALETIIAVHEFVTYQTRLVRPPEPGTLSWPASPSLSANSPQTPQTPRPTNAPRHAHSRCPRPDPRRIRTGEGGRGGEQRGGHSRGLERLPPPHPQQS